MDAFYSDNDKKACAWLRELMKSGLISEGVVDERSICDLQPSDLRGFRRVHLFAGIGAWDMALQLASWPDELVCWTGSCPCQPFSSSGRKKGFHDKRHLWPEMFRLIRECRPPIILGEQVERAIKVGWLDMVFDDLESEGYACGAVVFPACSVGARHIRQRIWWAADLADTRQQDSEGQQEDAKFHRLRPTTDDCGEDGWRKRWTVEPGMGRVVHGVLPGNPLVRHLGNAIVPQAAAVFIRAFLKSRED